MALMRVCGWMAFHPWSSVHSEAGFPDICAIRGKRIIFAELKRESGKATEAQLRWLNAADDAGAEAYLWKPSDWDGIERVLR